MEDKQDDVPFFPSASPFVQATPPHQAARKRGRPRKYVAPDVGGIKRTYRLSDEVEKTLSQGNKAELRELFKKRIREEEIGIQPLVEQLASIYGVSYRAVFSIIANEI